MVESKIGIAIVGTGFGQKVHIPGFQAHHRTEVVAVYNPDLAKAKAIAAEYNIPHASNDLNAIVKLPAVQG
ncbi:MAG: Gfo/Idh/MocA family oxidoreductase, partial [Jaaginema sp. PMC 1079.18]|nr:Gfo/Idh/MocA family oxidoreductase [Jaaginema sp. PMC 1079.18]